MQEMYSQNQTTSYRCIALVSGYHSCSFPPPEAYDGGLRERFAVIFSSYRPDKGVMFFDADLFSILGDTILRVIPHDSLEIEMDVGTPSLHSFPELREWYVSENDEREREPPIRMRVYSGDHLVAIEETEWWSLVGGPVPYHDSFTLSFYTAADRAIEFRRVCESVSRDNNVTITIFHEALSRKEPFVRWWKRPLR